jgi:hypothetical protein
MGIMDDKQYIIDLFNKYVRNKKIDLSTSNKRHNGAEGHWLETQMQIKHNSKNAPDIRGYEMKKNSKKITFGDFSASEYLFSKTKSIIDRINKWENDNAFKMTRNEFIKYFGNQNKKKHGRCSWSGKCIPTYGKYNECGQKLMISSKSNNIHIWYRYEKDEREHKKEYEELQDDRKLIAVWTSDKMQRHINNKFNKSGFFICKKTNNVYDKICFGKPFNFNHFIENIKNKNIIFDSGMYVGNNRNYSQFRSKNCDFWNNLIVEEF